VFSAEVVPREMQRQGRSKVVPLLGEPVCQTGESPHAHSHRQILALNVRGANPVLVWVTIDGSGNRLSQAGKTVAAYISGTSRAADFDQPGVI
jgi:hypothetical protein